MRIPTGSFGNLPLQVQPSGVQIHHSEAAGEAAHALGEELHQQLDTVIRARAADALLDYQIKIRDINEVIRQGAEDGSLHADQIEHYYQSAVSKLDRPVIAGLGPAGEEAAERGFRRYEAEGLAKARGYRHAALKTEARQQVDTQLDHLSKLTNYPDADVEKINAMSAGLEMQGHLAYGAQWEKVRQNWIDKNWFHQAQQRLMAARNNETALAALNHDLTAKEGYYISRLDPDKRNALLNQSLSYQARLEARAAAAEAKREALATRAINSLAPLIYSGNTPSPALLEQVTRATKGTSLEEEAKELMRLQPEVQSILRKGPLRSSRYVSQLHAELQKEGGTLADFRRLDMLDKAVKASNHLFATDPVTFAENRTGEAFQTLSLTDPASLSTQLSERAASLSALQQALDTAVPRTLLHPSEVEQLNQLFEKAPASQKAAVLDAIRQGTRGDDQAYKETLSQLATQHISAAVAGIIMDKPQAVLAEANRFSPDIRVSPRSAAMTILEGTAARKGSKETKGILMPGDNEMRSAFVSQVKDAFAGDSEGAERAYQVAQDYYAGVMQKKGVINGELDGDIWRQAINVATGGVYNYNGMGHILLPWGMSSTQFEKEITSAWKKQVSDAGIKAPPGHYGLQTYGDSQYLVRLGAGYLLDGQGHPVVLDVRQHILRDIPQ